MDKVRQTEIINREQREHIREATKKKGKKFHNSCELCPKMENHPPPISQQFQPLSELENLCFFAIIKSL